MIITDNKIRKHILENIGHHRVLGQKGQKPKTPEIETQVQLSSYVFYIVTPAMEGPLDLCSSFLETNVVVAKGQIRGKRLEIIGKYGAVGAPNNGQKPKSLDRKSQVQLISKSP